MQSLKKIHAWAQTKVPLYVKMYKYVNLIKNIPINSRVTNVVTKRPRSAKMMLGKPSSPLCILVAGQYKINKYAFDPNIP